VARPSSDWAGISVAERIRAVEGAGLLAAARCSLRFDF
jgi:hypothetical protein